jgi:Leucine-rich repeat (LRR) protein
LGLISLPGAFQLHHNRLTSIPAPPISLSHLHLSHNEIADIDGEADFKLLN